MKSKKKTVLFVTCVIVFVFSMLHILYSMYMENEQQRIIEEAKIVKEEEGTTTHQEKHMEEEQETQVEIEETVNPETEIILPEYSKLYEENSDIYGWISINDTVIDYPVMHTPDNPNYYIDKNWKKEDSKYGSIFIDARTENSTENIIIYGHNMKDRTMFGSLREYKEKSYFEEHKYIEFDTIYEKAKYEIIAVSKAIIYYDEVETPKDEYLFYEHVELDSKEEFDSYIESVKQNAYYDIDSTAEYGDSLITLCTCDYWTNDARLLVIAKKIN